MCQGLVSFMLQAPLVNTEENTDDSNEQETHVQFTLGGLLLLLLGSGPGPVDGSPSYKA